MEAQSSAVTLAVIGQKVDALDKHCTTCAERVWAALEKNEGHEANLQQRLSVLEDWRKIVNGSIDDLQEQYRSISQRLWAVFGGIVVVLLTLLGNIVLKRL